MRRAAVRLVIGPCLVVALLAIGAGGTAHADQGGGRGHDTSVPPFVPINKKIIQVPEGVQVGFPVYTKDGRHIVFTDVAKSPPKSNTWIVGADGKNLKCIDCGFADQPTGPYRDAIPFPDKKRLLLESGLGRNGGVDSGPEADAQVLECAPSLLNCASHRYLPIDMSSSKGAGSAAVSPDMAPRSRRRAHLLHQCPLRRLADDRRAA